MIQVPEGRGMDERTQVRTRLGPLSVRVRGDGPPAVLWHSLFVDERSWQRVEEALGRDRRLVIITGPGHGASPDPSRGYSMDDCAAAASDVLEALAIVEPVDWVGNAWGGHVGVVFASTWPDRCRTLVTLGTPIQAYSLSEQTTVRLLLVVYRLVGMVGFLSSSIVEGLLSPSTRANDPDAVALVLGCLRTMDRRGLGNAVQSTSLGRPDLTDRLAAIRCPTLFVTGSDHSGWWTIDQATAKSRLLATGSAAVVPDTGYLTPLEAPEATIKLVRQQWGFTHEGEPGAAVEAPVGPGGA
jgi:pimeloyl-ACP methyl ester carboxylesterase